MIGVKNIDELFHAIPQNLLIKRPELDDGLSEYEGLKNMHALADKNRFSELDNYLGAGAYEHHVPAIVDAIIAKSEFLTSYTPYQPEISQGYLQCFFEFQSALVALTGLDVANASVYDGASACAEGLLMALRAQKNKKRVLISQALNPHYREVIHQYLLPQKIVIDDLSMTENEFKEVAAILIQLPNFYGEMEDVTSLIAAAKARDVLVIIANNPLSCALYQAPSELGADIAVGDLQPFGISMQFGGPYAGYIACKKSLVRQIPGRLIGQTVDDKGKIGYVLTLQAREQHIRREKATSNICTNQALVALAALVTLSYYGKKGLPALALTNFQRASYLKERLCQINGITPYSDKPHFNEFTLLFDRPVEPIVEALYAENIAAGVPVKKINGLIIAVTETKSQEQLDSYVSKMREIFS